MNLKDHLSWQRYFLRNTVNDFRDPPYIFLIRRVLALGRELIKLGNVQRSRMRPCPYDFATFVRSTHWSAWTTAYRAEQTSETRKGDTDRWTCRRIHRSCHDSLTKWFNRVASRQHKRAILTEPILGNFSIGALIILISFH